MSILWGLLFLGLTLGGIYLMVMTPISRKYQSTPYVDIGTGGFMIVLAIIYVAITFIAPLNDEDNSTEPCMKKSPQAICYGLDPQTCSDAWKSFDDVCAEEAKPIQEKRPSALIYPIVYKCHAQKFDKIIYYNRRRTNNPFCQAYFNKIE